MPRYSFPGPFWRRDRFAGSAVLPGHQRSRAVVVRAVHRVNNDGELFFLGRQRRYNCAQLRAVIKAIGRFRR